MRTQLSAWLPPITAGFVAVLVGYTGAAIIVIQAFQAAGASPAMVGSWMTVLGLGMAVSTLGLSAWYRQPILTAWSTPGAALMVVGLHGQSLQQAVAAFMVCGVLTTLCGLTGVFARLMAWIPRALASAMLAGVLLQFGLSAFSKGSGDSAVLATTLTTWLLARRVMPRYAVLLMLVAGALTVWLDSGFASRPLSLSVSTPAIVWPAFSFESTIGLGLPLFVVTMAAQNAPGVAMLRNAGYQPPISSVLIVTGLLTTLLAPFGGFVICLAAITAGICLSPEAHEDPARRYRATFAAAVSYAIAGVLGGSIAMFLDVLPGSLIAILAGLALLPAIAASLATAMDAPADRDAAALTFIVTASGFHVMGIGAPFWGLAIGIAAQIVWQYRSRPGRRHANAVSNPRRGA